MASGSSNGFDGRPIVNIRDISTIDQPAPERLGPLKPDFQGGGLALSPHLRDIIAVVTTINDQGITRANADQLAEMLSGTVPVDFFVLECGGQEGVARLARLVEELPNAPEFVSLRDVVGQLSFNTLTEGQGLEQPKPFFSAFASQQQPLSFEQLMFKISEEGITNENIRIVIATVERLAMADFGTTGSFERLERRAEQLPQHMPGRGRLKNLVAALASVGREEEGALIPGAEAVEILTQRHRGGSWSNRPTNGSTPQTGR